MNYKIEAIMSGKKIRSKAAKAIKSINKIITALELIDPDIKAIISHIEELQEKMDELKKRS